MNNNYIYYYLFHIPPIYNWLRKLESPILKNYLEQKIKNNINNANNINNTNSINNFKNNNVKMINFNKNSFINNLKHYITQWEIVKLSASAKIKI